MRAEGVDILRSQLRRCLLDVIQGHLAPPEQLAGGGGGAEHVADHALPPGLPVMRRHSAGTASSATLPTAWTAPRAMMSAALRAGARAWRTEAAV